MDYEAVEQYDAPMPMAEGRTKKKSQPIICVQIPKKFNKGLTLGDQVEVRIKGIVKGFANREYDRSLDLEAKSFECEVVSDNEFEMMSREDD